MNNNYSKQAVAGLIAMALVATAPGLGSYQAAAQAVRSVSFSVDAAGTGSMAATGARTNLFMGPDFSASRLDTGVGALSADRGVASGLAGTGIIRKGWVSRAVRVFVADRSYVAPIAGRIAGQSRVVVPQIHGAAPSGLPASAVARTGAALNRAAAAYSGPARTARGRGIGDEDGSRVALDWMYEHDAGHAGSPAVSAARFVIGSSPALGRVSLRASMSNPGGTETGAPVSARPADISRSDDSRKIALLLDWRMYMALALAFSFIGGAIIGLPYTAFGRAVLLERIQDVQVAGSLAVAMLFFFPSLMLSEFGVRGPGRGVFYSDKWRPVLIGAGMAGGVAAAVLTGIVASHLAAAYSVLTSLAYWSGLGVAVGFFLSSDKEQRIRRILALIPTAVAVGLGVAMVIYGAVTASWAPVVAAGIPLVFAMGYLRFSSLIPQHKARSDVGAAIRTLLLVSAGAGLVSWLLKSVTGVSLIGASWNLFAAIFWLAVTGAFDRRLSPSVLEAYKALKFAKAGKLEEMEKILAGWRKDVPTARELKIIDSIIDKVHAAAVEGYLGRAAAASLQPSGILTLAGEFAFAQSHAASIHLDISRRVEAVRAMMAVTEVNQFIELARKDADARRWAGAEEYLRLAQDRMQRLSRTGFRHMLSGQEESMAKLAEKIREGRRVDVRLRNIQSSQSGTPSK